MDIVSQIWSIGPGASWPCLLRPDEAVLNCGVVRPDHERQHLLLRRPIAGQRPAASRAGPEAAADAPVAAPRGALRRRHSLHPVAGPTTAAEQRRPECGDRDGSEDSAQDLTRLRRRSCRPTVTASCVATTPGDCYID